MKVKINYIREDCGHACTPNGCPGHKTTIPESITIEGLVFHLKDFSPDQDDWPFRDERNRSGKVGFNHYVRVVELIEEKLSREDKA